MVVYVYPYGCVWEMGIHLENSTLKLNQIAFNLVSVHFFLGSLFNKNQPFSKSLNLIALTIV